MCVRGQQSVNGKKNRPVMRTREEVRESNHARVELILVDIDADADVHDVVEILVSDLRERVLFLLFQLLLQFFFLFPTFLSRRHQIDRAAPLQQRDDPNPGRTATRIARSGSGSCSNPTPCLQPQPAPFVHLSGALELWDKHRFQRRWIGARSRRMLLLLLLLLLQRQLLLWRRRLGHDRALRRGRRAADRRSTRPHRIALLGRSEGSPPGRRRGRPGDVSPTPTDAHAQRARARGSQDRLRVFEARSAREARDAARPRGARRGGVPTAATASIIRVIWGERGARGHAQFGPFCRVREGGGGNVRVCGEGGVEGDQAGSVGIVDVA